MKLASRISAFVSVLCAATLLLSGCGSSSSSPSVLGSVQAVQDVLKNYTISWAPAAPNAVVQVTGGPSPSTIDAANILGTTTGGTVVTLSGLDTTHRWYFNVAQQGGPGRIVAARHVSLAGPANFRDLGGYPTADGRQTKWGVFFRSDSLNSLTPADTDYLANSGIKLDVDLRDDAEVASAADIPASDNRFAYVRQPIEVNGMSVQSIHAAGVAFDDAAMALAYEQSLDSYAASYAGLFRALASQGAGAVFHCTHGKDRTGMASALLLMTANVPDSVIVADYSLTDQYLAVQEAATVAALPASEVALLGVAFYTPPAVMQAVLTYIRQKYGSAGAYLQSGGLDPATLAKVVSDFVQ